MSDYYVPQRYVGLRITVENEEKGLDLYKMMEFENKYFYAFHSADNGCKHGHVHFVIVRDWDATLPIDSNSKKLRRLYVSKSGLSGNKDFALSFHTNTLIEAGNYLAHDPDAMIKFSEGDWQGFDKFKFEYKEYKKAQDKPDMDIEKRRRDLDHIPLSRFNLVPTLQRLDRIRKRPKRSFKDALKELLTTTRYRPNKELLEIGRCPRELVEEYERGVQESAKTWLDRFC